MKPWKRYCTGLVLAAGLVPFASADGLPAITPPPGLAIAPQPPPVNAPVPPAALPPNIWDKLLPRADQKAACKAKICNSRIGQLLNNMLMPAGAMTGGLIGPCCPTINAADLAKPPDSAEGAAARLKLDEADAAARRAAVRYMAGADCHYWPEVTEALIGALRADRNECVRLEAALALGRGCCCNRATMLALTLTVSGATDDGNPPEDSDRVKMAALAALNHCLANYTEVVPAPVAAPEAIPIPHEGERPPVTPPGENPPPMAKPGDNPGAGANRSPAGARPFSPTEFYHHPENLDEKKVVEKARRAVEHVTPVASAAPPPAADHSVFGIALAAMTTAPGPVVQAVAVAEPPAAIQPVKSSPPPPAAVQPVKSAPAPPAAVPTDVAPAGYFPPSWEKAGTRAAAPRVAAPAVAPPSHTAETVTIVAPPPPVPASAPAKAAPAGNAGVIVNMIGVLRDSIYPEEREKAADALGGCDAWANPNAVQALVEAARSDAAPGVRAASLRSLTRMNVRTLPVATVAQALRTDPDPRVRSEAEQTLQRISGSSHSQ